jgi:hypothetical protein
MQLVNTVKTVRGVGAVLIFSLLLINIAVK